MRSKPNHIHLIAILIATLICVAQPEMVLGKDAIDGKDEWSLADRTCGVRMPVALSTFATVRLRTTKTKGCLSRMTTLTMVFMLCQSARKKWRRLDGSHQIGAIIQGVKFKDGEKLTERAA